MTFSSRAMFLIFLRAHQSPTIVCWTAWLNIDTTLNTDTSTVLLWPAFNMVAISPILIASYLLTASNDSTGGRGVTRRIGTRGAAGKLENVLGSPRTRTSPQNVSANSVSRMIGQLHLLLPTLAFYHVDCVPSKGILYEENDRTDETTRVFISYFRY